MGVSRKPGSARFHRTVAVLLILASVATPLAVTAVWLRGEVLDTHRYVHTVTPLASNHAVVAAVSDQITTELLARVNLKAAERKLLPSIPVALRQFAPSLDAAVHSYVEKAVETSLGTKEFKRLWVLANTEAHTALVAALEGKTSPLLNPDGSVDIDLSNAVAVARQSLGAAGLHLFDHVQPAVVKPHFELARPGALRRARHAVETLKTLSVVLPAAAIVLFALAFTLSRDRRRTLFHAGAGLAAASVVGIVAIVVGRSYYLNDIVGADVPRDAAIAFYDTLLGSLRFWLKLVCVAGIGAIAIAVVAGPSRLAVRVRSLSLRTAGGLADEAVGTSVTARFVAEHKSTLRTVTVIGALLVLVASHDVNGRLLLGLAAGVLVVLGAIEILSRPGGPKRSGGAVP